MAFPSLPVDGQVYTTGGVTYTYNSTKGVWQIQTYDTVDAAGALTSIKTVDGAGSGLDADTLDGYTSGDFWRKAELDYNDVFTGERISYTSHIPTTITLESYLADGGFASSYGATNTGWDAPFSYGGVIGYEFSSGIQSQVGFDIRHNQTAYGDFWFRTRNNLGFSNWSKVWHNNNDGAGSGLDADLLDGLQGTSYARVDGGYVTIPSSASDPSGATAGDVYFNTGDGILKVYTGSSWVAVYTPPVNASGGTEVTSGGYKYHTFTSSGTFTVGADSGTDTAEVLIVAGGAGGGSRYGGGGGAGGLVSTTWSITPGSYSIVVGGGGSGATMSGSSSGAAATNGGNSSAFGTTATGGGRGGSADNNQAGASGGSGGGAQYGYAGGAGTAGQGNAGGDGNQYAGITGSYTYQMGGGGGKSQAGGDGNGVTGQGGHGGDGSNSFSTWASATGTGDGGYYAGGGGGGTHGPSLSGYVHPGGLGGGGNSGTDMSKTPGLPGQSNTGGGGGGASTDGGGDSNTYGGNGGSGIVIIRYPAQEQYMSHFAKVVDGIVVDVIVAEPDFFETFVDTSPGEWLQTSYNTKGGEWRDPVTNLPSDDGTPFRKNYACVSFLYDKKLDAFIPPKPFESWILNTESCLWEAPVEEPTDGEPHEWNEATQSWESI